jgi:hypothetical protein
MKPASLHGCSAVFIGILAAALLVLPPAAFAIDFIFVFDGLIGTFRSLEAGTATEFPPAEVEMNYASSSGSPKGRYEKAPRCILPDCGYVSVTANGSIFTSPARFHGHNNGWQLLITSPTPSDASVTRSNPAAEFGKLYGTLMYCPGYEVDGDDEKCPAPGPSSEPRAGRLYPPPHGDPGDHGVPGPLPFLGVAAAFGFSRRLRSRSRGPISDSSRTDLGSVQPKD